VELISRAQNQEDVMLWRALKDVENGFYIDVGAADPDHFSVTSIFYQNGWTGINLEPSSVHYDQLLQKRPHDRNLRVAVDEISGEKTFFEIPGSGLSTLERSVAEQHEQGQWAVREVTVTCCTLAEICNEHVGERPVHFLKIDVEGAEERVLRGADFHRCRPWIVVVEATRPLSQTADHERWEHLLLDNAYAFAWFDGLNRFYVACEHGTRLLPHFKIPPNVFDGFLGVADVINRIGEDLKEAELRATKAEAQLAAEAHDLRNRLDQAAKAEALITQLAAEAHDLRNRLDQSERTAAAATEGLATKIANISENYGFELNRVQEELRVANETVRNAIAQYDPSVEARLREANEGRALAESWNAALRDSTSWRITRPLRGGMYLLRGRISLKEVFDYIWGRQAPVPSPHAVANSIPVEENDLLHVKFPSGQLSISPEQTAQLSPSELHLYRVLSQRIRSA